MDRFLSVAKALSDPSRVRALFALRGGELCACQIIALLNLAPSTVSKHMSILRQAGLVRCRKEERWMHYRLPGDDAPGLARDALALLFDSTGTDETIKADRDRLRSILKKNPSELCRELTTS